MTLTEALTRVPAIGATAPATHCSARYAFIPTVRLLEPLLAQGWTIESVHQNAQPDMHALHRVDLRMPATPLGERLVGELFPTATIVNSHNCTRQLSWDLGMHVCVCNNQLITPVEGLGEHIVRRHAGDAETIIASLLGLGAKPDSAIGAITRMQAVELDYIDRLGFACKALMHATKRPSVDWIDPDDALPLLLAPRESQRNARDVWTTLNVVQENLIERGRTGRGIHEILRNTRLNKALWSEAVALLRN